MINELENGGKVSDEVICRLLKKRLSLADVFENGFVLDGYPKN